MNWTDWSRTLLTQFGLFSESPHAGEASTSRKTVMESEQSVLQSEAGEQLRGRLGLALSGGGIRSASFNLGLLQALADLKLLRKVDYLSTVSGGGYIGSWLSALIHREIGKQESGSEKEKNRLAIAKVEERIGVRRGQTEDPAVQHLRRFSNYLSPRLGFFSADAWSAVATYLRNLLLNLLVLTFGMGAMLAAPYLLLAIEVHSPAVAGGLLLSGLVLAGLPAWAIGLNFGWFAKTATNGNPPLREQPNTAETQPDASATQPKVAIQINQDENNGKEAPATHVVEEQVQPPHGQSALLGLIVFPLTLIALLATFWAPAAVQNNIHFAISVPTWLTDTGVFGYWIVPVAIAHFGVWLFACISAKLTRYSAAINGRNWRQLLLWALLSGAAMGPALHGIAELLVWLEYRSLQVSLGPPLLLSWIYLLAVLHTGFLGRELRDRQREWLSRLGAWLLIIAVTWLGVAILSFFSTVVWDLAEAYVQTGLGIGWLLTTVGGLLAARGPAGTGFSGTVRRWLMMLAPYIFVLGLLGSLSAGLHEVFDIATAENGAVVAANEKTDAFHQALAKNANMRRLCDLSPTSTLCQQEMRSSINVKDAGIATALAHLQVLDKARSLPLVLLVLAALIGLALLFSLRIDVNEFSMHHFYGNRLVRAYLGASVDPDKRRNQPFTGFSPDDNIPLTAMREQRPIQLINTAINLVAGEELAWQERKAASFLLSPKWCGFTPLVNDPEPCYRDTRYFAAEMGARLSLPLSLGEAMTTSGAAASPNMGYKTTAAYAFLLSVFNVRLGRWIGNPKNRHSWTRSGPRFALIHLLAELFGSTRGDTRYVYLSDGGHFDNLGLYELVRRRCRYIIVSDAGADPDMVFDDLGNALRKCRADFGVDIHLHAAPIRQLDEGRFNHWSCVVGEIHYDHDEIGTLLYIKATLPESAPEDVLNYAAVHPTFPHQATADQFFSESQFESYRRLGCYITEQTLRRSVEEITGKGHRHLNIEGLFGRLIERWHPPTAVASDVFARHGATWDLFLERLRSDEELKFLDAQFFPEWPFTKDSREILTVPKDETQFRSGFYFCNSLLQFMENVYLDLRLESDWDHPDNRGWINLFRHWTWSGMFRATWAISASTYGRRFKHFCESVLNLHLGTVSVVQIVNGDDEKAASSIRLNFLEEQQITTYRTLNPGPALQLYTLVLSVTAPTEASTDLLRFHFGYALIRNGVIELFRVQDHLRKMGLARRALIYLFDRQHGNLGQRLGKVVLDPQARHSLSKSEQAHFTALQQEFEEGLGKVRFAGLFQSAKAEWQLTNRTG